MAAQAHAATSAEVALRNELSGVVQQMGVLEARLQQEQEDLRKGAPQAPDADGKAAKPLPEMVALL
jgi:hypothetical protein